MKAKSGNGVVPWTEVRIVTCKREYSEYIRKIRPEKYAAL